MRAPPGPPCPMCCEVFLSRMGLSMSHVLSLRISERCRGQTVASKDHTDHSHWG